MMYTTFQFVQTISTQRITATTKAAISKASNQMETLEKLLDKALKKLISSKQTTLMSIQTFRNEVNQILDELETTTKKELENQCQMLHEQWQTMDKLVTAILQDFKKYSDQLENTNHNISQQFVISKISKESISMAEKIGTKLQPSSMCVTFSENMAVKQYLKQLPSIGKLDFYIEQGKLGLYTVKQSSAHNVKLSSDYYTCLISGSCVLDSGALLLADAWNNKLKLLDTSKNTVTGYCTFPASPNAVCAVSYAKAAVSLTNKTIQFISIEKEQLLPTRILQMNHACYGLAIAGDNMYITDRGHHRLFARGTNLYMHAMNGALLQTMDNDQKGQKIFSCIRHVSSSNYGNVHVGDYTYGLITLDTSGQIVWKYAGSDLKGTCSVCTDGCGNVFVCGEKSHNVLQLGQDGCRMGALVTQTQGLNYPAAVCFDKQNSRLIVSNYKSDTVLVFYLQ